MDSALATLSAPSSDPGVAAASILPWIVALIVFVVLGGVAILAVRNWAADTKESTDPGFSLAKLRELHQKGELSQAEYQRAVEAMRRRVKGPVPGEESGLLRSSGHEHSRE